MLSVTKNIKHLDKTAFEKLFREYFVPLTAFAKKYVGDVDSAKEIVHDVFVNLWTKRETIDLEKAVKSYLYTSAYNRSLNYIRDHKKFNSNVSVEDNFSKASDWNFENNIDALELEEKINRVINSLPEKCKEVFLMSRFEGLKYQEIADKLNISVKTVEAQMSKALKALKENLKDYLTVLILLLMTS
ncbi:MAG: RNA polymerase sigma-70 factor [Chloroflexia bacterium]|nr:RNA polymerase sigma-70 factor [Chloroflexia bacterium]